MPSRLKGNMQQGVSRGIIEIAIRSRKMSSELDAREFSQPDRQVRSELPTIADLVLPGTGHKFSDEFACLLNALIAGGEYV